MNITDVKIFKSKQTGPILAYANIILDRTFIIRGIKLLETERNGKFLSMPSRKLKKNKKSYRDICHPLNSNIRQELTEIVFSAYNEFINS